MPPSSKTQTPKTLDDSELRLRRGWWTTVICLSKIGNIKRWGIKEGWKLDKLIKVKATNLLFLGDEKNSEGFILIFILPFFTLFNKPRIVGPFRRLGISKSKDNFNFTRSWFQWDTQCVKTSCIFRGNGVEANTETWREADTETWLEANTPSYQTYQLGLGNKCIIVLKASTTD